MHKMKYTTHMVCKHCSKSYMHPGCVGKAEEESLWALRKGSFISKDLADVITWYISVY